ncbi:MAG: hypothetical protein MI802_19875 [Desulfobacterales bacterium]|nr:hypothetical protein [Desulfobacterales bacterium]
MSRREIIILIIALIVVIVGLIDLLFLSGNNTDASDSLNTELSEAQAFSSAAMAKIAKLEKQSRQENWGAWISRIETPWSRDPFIVDHGVNRKKERVKQDRLLIYSGFVSVAGKSFAVINGIEYTHNETILPEGYVVHQISPAQVVLKKAGKQFTIYLEEE